MSLLSNLIPWPWRRSSKWPSPTYLKSSDPIHLDDYASRIGLDKHSVQIQMIDEGKYISPEHYLFSKNIGPADISFEQRLEIVQVNHRLTARNRILKVLTALMVIIPAWALIFLSLSFAGKVKLSSSMQFTLIGILSADVLGLCVVITTDLFPNGKQNQHILPDSSDNPSSDD